MMSDLERRLKLEKIRRAEQLSTLEEVLTSPKGFGIKTATPLQVATCRLIDGIPLGAELREHPHVKAAVGDVSQVEGHRPKKVVLCAGIRTFKSMIAAGVGILSPQRVDTSPMMATEGARFAVASISKDKAYKVLLHAIALTSGEQAALRIAKEERSKSKLVLPAHDGREFTFQVAAGSRAGGTLVSDWSSGVVFDEAARMLSSDQGVINLDDSIDAVEGRILPGGQMFLLSSPWAPFGTFHDFVMQHHGKSTPDILVIWAEGPWLNPVWWTEERCEKLKQENESAWITDVKARFKSPEEGIWTDHLIDESTVVRRETPPEPGHTYRAAIDPGTRGNAWALIVVTRTGQKVKVVKAKEWVGTTLKPLRPREVLAEIRDILGPYDCTSVTTDQWSFDALQDIASPMGLYLVEHRMTQAEKIQAAGKIRVLMEDRNFELITEENLRTDMLRAVRKTTQSGVSLVLPVTSDGRHCDYIPPLLLACAPYLTENEEPEPEYGTPEYWAKIEKEDIERDIAELEAQMEGEEW